MKKISIAILIGFLTLITIFYLNIKFNSKTLIVGPSCRSSQEVINFRPLEKTFTKYAVEIPVAIPFVELPYVRIMLALLEVIALYLSYIKIKQN